VAPSLDMRSQHVPGYANKLDRYGPRECLGPAAEQMIDSDCSTERSACVAFLICVYLQHASVSHVCKSLHSEMSIPLRRPVPRARRARDLAESSHVITLGDPSG